MKNVLYITHRVPYPPDKGDRIRNYNVLRFLGPRCNVSLACLADEDTSPEVIQKLQAFCSRVFVSRLNGTRWLQVLATVSVGGSISEGAFYSAELFAQIRAWDQQHLFDAVLLSSSSLGRYLNAVDLRKVKVVTDFVDLDSAKWKEYSTTTRWPKSWIFHLEAKRLQKAEIELCRRSSQSFFVSQAEVDLFRRFCDYQNVDVVTNGVDLDYFSPGGEAGEETVTFVGALDYWPNVQGICHFCEYVWPEVLKRKPSAVLNIVGRRPTAQVQDLAKLVNVRLLADVPDVRPPMRASTATVVPLNIARGVQNKVLESLAMGKPTVVSPQAIQGIGVSPGKHVLVAETPSQWVEALCGLFDRKAERERLGHEGRTFVLERHNWDKCLSELGSALDLGAK